MTRYPTRPGVPSENGWPMVDRSGVTVFTIPGVPAAKAVPLRTGDVATILIAFIQAYNAHVEPVRSQVWGYSSDNDVADSNHMSGTGIDINAPWYNWGSYTMSPELVGRINRVLASFDGVIEHGRKWSRPDEMHYQIGVRPGDPRVAALAQRIRAGGTVTVPAPSSGLLRRGSTGDRVRGLQARLNRDYPRYSRLAVDGDFGPATEAVVREFQARAGLSVDGIAGPDTLRRLGLS